MDYDKLVADVLNELHDRLSYGANNSWADKKLMIIGTLLDKDITCLKEAYQLVHFSDEKSRDKYNQVLITHMPCEMLGNLAVGAGDKTEGFILKTLMEGGKVFVLESALMYKNYKKTAFKTLYALYSECEKKLLQYGISIIESPLDIVKDTGKKELSNRIVSDKIDLSEKNLILESDFMKKQIRESSAIKLNSSCIITPLAQDYIKNHNLVIIRE